jgi:DNA polymerase-4
MILHIDMDAFYAAVEQRDNPALRGKCLIVGGPSARGVVTTASYEARRYGVRSAMPMFEARRRCPHAIVIPGRMARYKAVSREIMELLRGFTPLVEPVSIDEAYLDIGGLSRLFGPPEQVARRIKQDIRQTTGLTCSIGGAPLRFLAKIASDLEKPDGLTILTPEAVPDFIAQLPVEKIPGVGSVAKQHLDRLNLATMGDVRRCPQELLMRRLGKFGHRLAELARGVDATPVTPYTAAKSVSSEETLAADTNDRRLLHNLLLHHAEDVARQLRRLGLKARTITLKIKHADFQQVTRSKTLPRPVQATESILAQADALLQAYALPKRVRLIGVGASHFVPAAAPVQAELFPRQGRKEPNWEKVDHTLDAIHAKFGRGAIRKATFVDAPKDATRANRDAEE